MDRLQILLIIDLNGFKIPLEILNLNKRSIAWWSAKGANYRIEGRKVAGGSKSGSR